MSLKLNERYPGRYNNPSADYPQGSFKNRTAPTAKDGSYLEQDWANDKEGFFQSLLATAVIEANGAVDKVGASQAFDALLQLGQGQAGVAFTTGGTATVLTLTPIPAIQAYAVNQRFSVKFNVTAGLNPTLNVSAKGAKNLKQYGPNGVKIAATFAADQISDIVYDGTDWVVLGPLQADATTTTKGIARFGTPAEQLAGLLATVASNPAGVLALLTAWFPKRTFATNDFIRIPDVSGGLIIQFGQVTTLAGADTPVTFPTPFPLALRGLFGQVLGNTLNTGYVFTSESETVTGFSCNAITTGGRNAVAAAWFSFGF